MRSQSDAEGMRISTSFAEARSLGETHPLSLRLEGLKTTHDRVSVRRTGRGYNCVVPAVAPADKASPFPTDRTFAVSLAAFTLGIALIWLATLVRGVSDPNFGAWMWDKSGAHGEYVLSVVYTLWLCAAVYRGRRWAFFGLAFQGIRISVQGFIYGVPGHAVVSLISLVYCLLRLASILGKAPPRLTDAEPFLPDRFVAATVIVIDVGTALSALIRPLPGQPVTPTGALWMLCAFPELFWFQWSAYRSRGWAMGIGLLLMAMGFLMWLPYPEQRLHKIEVTLGFLYFGLRLTHLGPRPKGFLGIASD